MKKNKHKYKYGVRFYWADGSIWGNLYYSSHDIALKRIKRFHLQHKGQKSPKYIGKFKIWNKEREAV